MSLIVCFLRIHRSLRIHMDNKLKLYNANFREGYWEELQELTNEKNTMQDFFQ